MNIPEPIESILAASEEPWVRLALARWNGNTKAIPGLVRETAGHPLVAPMIEECASWPHYTLQRHNDARHAFHKIGLLIDFGLDAGIPGIAVFCKKVLEHQSPDGGFLCETLIPKAFRGSGVVDWQWISCDFPLLLHALLALGFEDDPRVKKGLTLLTGLVRENGWGCHASAAGFRGPGKSEAPCPIVNVMALKALSLDDSHQARDACRKGTEMLLRMWENRKTERHFLFAMGRRFQKLKYPLFWFDIMNTADALSRFEWTHADPRFQEMTDLVRGKTGKNGMLTPESVWMAFKEFDFGQKKLASPMLTLAVQRISVRISRKPTGRIAG